MPKIHPNEFGLRSLLAEPLEQSRKVLEHLLDCSRCRVRLQALLNNQSRASSRFSKAIHPAGVTPDYSHAFALSEGELESRQRAFEQERSEAGELISVLLSCPPARQDMLLRNSARFQTWGVLERLLEKSREVCAQAPEKAAHLARLALLQAEYMDASYYGHCRLEDMRARAWSCIGNVRRIQSDLDGSEEALETAMTYLRKGTQDSVERAIVLDLKASLRRAQRRFSEAASLLRRAYDIFLRAGETHRAGRSLVNLATVHEQAGSPAEAIPLLYEAMRLVDADSDPRLLLCVRHNLITNLTEAGRLMEAQRALIETQPLYRRFPEVSVQSRLKWVQAKIFRRLGRYREAEELFLAAHEELISAGLIHDSALLALELASLYSEQGRSAEIKRLTEEVQPFFESQKIQHEALAVLAAF